jgi:hypothetical protein
MSALPPKADIVQATKKKPQAVCLGLFELPQLRLLSRAVGVSGEWGAAQLGGVSSKRRCDNSGIVLRLEHSHLRTAQVGVSAVSKTKRDPAVFSIRCCGNQEERHHETVRILRRAPGSDFVSKGQSSFL